LSTWLLDGGSFAKAYLAGAPLNKELLNSADFQAAGSLFMLLYLPFAAAFWHAPALVHWHGVSPGKSLFFSLVACWRNKGAMLIFGIAWVAVMTSSFLFVLLLSGLIGGKTLVGIVMVPTSLLVASMFFVSFYFTFQDSFVTEATASA
jgi:hypothetical protein